MSLLYRIITIAIVLLCVVLLGRIGLAAPPTAATTTNEAWRLGVTSEGGVADSALLGRPVSIAASFRSNRSVQDIFFAFPASGRTQTVQSAAYQILQRSGAYTSTTSLTLEVRDSSGALQRSISAAPVDLQTAATGAWTTLALEASPASLTIAPGEHLVAHFAIAGAPAGTLDVRPVFEVIVTSDPGTASTPTPTATATPSATPTTTIIPARRTLYLPLLKR
ncbi:MAG TPA: hypothetical protein VFU22_29920 [Roseiflexaceae bacterium]|nr:hypothetical protein [Roseiflexaceae bacterium]